MSDSAVVTPPTVIPKTVTVDSQLVIETLAAMNAVGSLLSFLDVGEDGALAAEWIHGPAAKLEETSFNTEGVGDDDPLVVAVVARSEELAAEVMSYYDELLPKASEYFHSARKIRETGERTTPLQQPYTRVRSGSPITLTSLRALRYRVANPIQT